MPGLPLKHLANIKHLSSAEAMRQDCFEAVKGRWRWVTWRAWIALSATNSSGKLNLFMAVKGK
jgi:hypothetical protein